MTQSKTENGAELIWDFQQGKTFPLEGPVKNGICLGLSHHWLCIRVSSGSNGGTLGQLPDEIRRNLVNASVVPTGAARTQVDAKGLLKNIVKRQVCDHISISPDGFTFDSTLTEENIRHGQNLMLTFLSPTGPSGHAIAVSLAEPSYVFDANIGEYKFTSVEKAKEYVQTLAVFYNNIGLSMARRIIYSSREIVIRKKETRWFPKLRFFS